MVKARQEAGCLEFLGIKMRRSRFSDFARGILTFLRVSFVRVFEQRILTFLRISWGEGLDKSAPPKKALPCGFVGVLRGKDCEGSAVESMYTVNVVHRHPWTGRIIWQSSLAKALQGPLQNFGNISVFLPGSDSARAQGVAIGLAPCEFKRFSGRYPAGLWHLAQNARSLECSRH